MSSSVSDRPTITAFLRRQAACALGALLFSALAPAAIWAEVTNPNGVAVIIGNKSYRHDLVPEVSYAHRDAAAFKRYVLDVLGYDPLNLIELDDAGQADLESAFGNERSHEGLLWRYLDPDGGSDVVVFYSGHGVPGLKDGRGYLLPSDARPDTAELNGYPIDLLYENLGKLQEARSIAVYLDACFSGNSHEGMLWSASPIIWSPELRESAGAKVEVTMLTAASGEEVASWDEQARHGLFTNHLLDALYGKADADGDGQVTAGEAHEYLGRYLKRAARRMFGRHQNASLIGSAGVVLSSAVQGAFPVRPELRTEAEEQADAAFAQAQAADTTTAYEAYLQSFPQGGHAEEARRLMSDATERALERKRPGQVFRDCQRCPELVVVPAGWFMMGASPSENGRNHNEVPVHRVTIAEPVAVGVYEVTFDEWEACVAGGGCREYRPLDEGWGRANRPVINVSWNDAQEYVKWLTRKTGEYYRLLSEAEWEYVARGRTITARYWGDTKSGQCQNGNGADRRTHFRWAATCDDEHERTAPVGVYTRNGYGLYDMIGNVWEWTQDCWNDSYTGAPNDGKAWEMGDCSRRVLRGGSWIDRPDELRAASRVAGDRDARDSYSGFRIARIVASSN